MPKTSFSLQIDANCDVNNLLHNLSFAADMVVNCIQENHCVDGLHRPLLPALCGGKNLVRIRLTVVSEIATP